MGGWVTEAPFVAAWSIIIGGRQALVCGTGAEIRGDKGGAAEAAPAAALGRRVGSTCFAAGQPDASTASAFSPCK